MRRKFISLFVALLMCVGLLPTKVFAVEYYSGIISSDVEESHDTIGLNADTTIAEGVTFALVASYYQHIEFNYHVLTNYGTITTAYSSNEFDGGTFYNYGVCEITGFYNVTVYDLTLSSIVLSSGTLSPSFAAGTREYAVTVDNSVTSIDITPTLNTETGVKSMTVNGTTATSGAASTVSLDVGENSIPIVITANDGSDTANTYTLTVTRASAATHTHSLTHVETQGATCTETGNNEYWYCSVCGGYFSDAGALGTTTLNDVTIAALGHSLTYTASENIITESCANWWCGHSATATLAESSSLVYDGSTKAASVSYDAEWMGDTPTVNYLDSSGAAVDAENVVNAGAYTAQITVGGATASVSFTITAAQIDTPKGLAWSDSTAIWDSVSNASSYSVQLYKDGTAEGSVVTTNSTSYTFNITEAGSYTFKVTAIGEGNYSDSAESFQSSEIVYYTVTWSDGSEVIETQIVQSGDTPTVPANPTKETDSQYTYTFAGWDKEITAVTGDVTYTATYTATTVSSGSNSSSSKSSGGSSHSLTETTSSKSDTTETADTTDTASPTGMASPTGASSGTTGTDDTDYVIGGDGSTTTTIFTDVDSTNQYSEAIDYVVSNGLMAGTSATTFEPEAVLTRGMIVTILHRLEGEPESDADHGFHDVHDSAWYAEAVAWAAEVGIASGYGDGSFGPEDAITREQLAAILYRYAEYKGYDVSAMASLGGYTDSHEVGDWAVAAMEWANANGLLDVKGFSSIEPKSEASRAETASTLMTFVENITK